MTTSLKPKREAGSRQFILINEENLIKEVRKRPILYDKSLKGYRKPSTREQSWREVAYALNCTRKCDIFCKFKDHIQQTRTFEGKFCLTIRVLK